MKASDIPTVTYRLFVTDKDRVKTGATYTEIADSPAAHPSKEVFIAMVGQYLSAMPDDFISLHFGKISE